MFSIVNSVLFDPLNYRDPARLYAVVNLPPPSVSDRYWLVNSRHFNEWRTHCGSCEDIGLAEGMGFILTGLGEPERFPGLRVTYNFFRTLGVRPALGRDFLPEEELPDRFHEVILTDSVWRSRFDSDPNVLGRIVQVNGEPHTIVGVMPADFRLPVGSQWGPTSGPAFQPLMFRPFGQDVSQTRPIGTYNYVSVVRLKPGIESAKAIAELNAIIADFVSQFHIELKPTILPLRETVTRGARAGLWLLLGAVAAVLLTVCVNVGNLMLVRTASRDREVGIRLALGSSKSQLFALVLTEALVLVGAGSGVGLLISYAGLRAFVALAPVDLPRIADIHMGPRTFVFALSIAAVSAIICGMLPAWRLSRVDPQDCLRSGGANSTAQRPKVRFREILVSVEVALSAVLLVVGGLLVFSFLRVVNGPKGFELDQVIAQDVALMGPKYRDAAGVRFIDQALTELAALPGVLSVGVTNQIPLRGEQWICDLRDAGSPGRAAVGLANFRFVNGEYWRTLGIPLQEGRLFEPADRGRKVVVISERAARLLWPNQDPIGKIAGACAGELVPTGAEVIGVVGEVRAGAEREAPLTVYQPYWTASFSRPFFVIKTAQPSQVIPAVRKLIRSLDADLPITQSVSMREVLDDAVASRRFQMNLALAFAISALLVASMGIYGVISFTVARRTPELGIRRAIGAPALELASMVLREGMKPVLFGLAAGLIVAIGIGRLIASELYGVAPHDPLTIVTVVLMMLFLGVCACWIPARRAMHIDPLKALRFE
jgi:putative ABC transport system permease protein